jgi:hypothetical protein
MGQPREIAHAQAAPEDLADRRASDGGLCGDPDGCEHLTGEAGRRFGHIAPA